MAFAMMLTAFGCSNKELIAQKDAEIASLQQEKARLEGEIAEKRLERARELARTGTFVARIDDEVFKNMSREQLEGVAERAWRRAHGDLDSSSSKTPWHIA